jgi:hypothetical protein
MALNPEEKALVQKLARKVVRWGLTVPAILSLEVHRPLSFMASQAMHFVTPFVSMFLDAKEFQTLASMLERRETIEDVIVAIEEADASAEDARRLGRAGGAVK